MKKSNHLHRYLPESGGENLVCLCGKTKKKDNSKNYYPQRKPLRRKSKSPIALCKDRIQHLLTEGARARDGGCIMRLYPETGSCGGVTAADHIVSRQYHLTYGILENMVCLCTRHHIWWKPSNSTIYSEVVKRHIGQERWDKIHKLRDESPKTQSYSLFDWELIEKNLIEEIASLYKEDIHRVSQGSQIGMV